MDGIILQGVLGFSQGAAMAAVLAAVVSSNVREMTAHSLVLVSVRETRVI